MYMPLPSTGSGIEIANATLPSWLRDYDNEDILSLCCWFWPDNTGFRARVGIEGLMYFYGTNGGNAVRVVADGDTTGANVAAVANAGTQLMPRLLLASWNPAEHRLRMVAVTPSQPSGVTNDTIEEDFVLGPTRNLCMGTAINSPWSGQENNLSGAIGYIGPVCFRRGVEATLEAAVAMYSSKSIMAPLMHSDHGFNGLNDDIFAINHSMAQSPIGVGVSAVVGARYGVEVVSGRVGVMSTSESANSLSQQLIEVRPLSVVFGDLIFRDHNELDPDFFETREPGVTTDGTVGNSEIAAMLGRLDEITTHIKIGVWSNSRGMRTQGGYSAIEGFSEEWDRLPGSHANGFIAACMDRNPAAINGIIRAPLELIASSPANRRRWIFDGIDGPYLDGTANNVPGGFGRYWTGNNSSDIPGTMLALAASTVYSFKAREEPGSVTTRDVPLRITIDYFAYPGGRNFEWENVEAVFQSDSGTEVGPSGSVSDCDTTEFSHTFDVGDTYNAGNRTLSITSQGEPQVGWAIYVLSGDGAGSIAEIESIDGGTITLRHAFDDAISSGSILLFGPVEYRSTSYISPPSSLPYRGPRITTSDQAFRGRTMLCGYSAWAVDGSGNALPGVAFAAMGTGGAGYALQVERGQLNSAGHIAKHLGFDAVFLHGATQSSTAEDMHDFAEMIRDVAGCEVVMLADMVHSVTQSTHSYAEHILGQTDFAGAVATERNGAFDELVNRGGIYDVNHPSIFGMKSLAGHYLDLFEQNFIIPARFNGNALCLPDTDPDPTGTFRPVLRFVESEGRVLSSFVQPPDDPNGHTVEFQLAVNIDDVPQFVATVPVDGGSAPATMVAFMAEVAEQAAEYTTPITLDIALASGIDADAAPIDVLRLAQSNLGLEGTAYLIGNVGCTPISTSGARGRGRSRDRARRMLA